MRIATPFLILLFLFSACPDETESLNEGRKELIEEVGGAPKKTIDATQKRLNDSMKKMDNRLESETADIE